MKSICTLLLAACLVSSAAREARGAACTLKYYGGPVISNPKVVVVFWGGSLAAQTRTNIGGFYTAIVNSPYIDWLSEYNTVGLNGQDGSAGSNQGISRGSVVGTYTIAPVQCGGTANCTLTDAQIQAEIGAQIAAGTLPGPTTGCDGQNDTIYALHFASNVTITYSGNSSCVQFCYYHGSGTINGKTIVYTVNPDVTMGGCVGGCGNDTTPFNNQTSVASAALFSAITDPSISTTTSSVARPLGWYADSATCGEIAGICNAQQGTITVGGATWTVQKQWSNALASCVVSRSPLPAICTGSGTPTGCRSCACADNGQGASGQVGCSGATPRCDTTARDSSYGECVATGTGGAGGTAGTAGTGGASGTGGTGGGTGGVAGTTGGGGSATGGSGGGAGGATGGATGGAGGATGGATGGAGGSSGGASGSTGAGGAGGKPAGTEGGACYGNGTCNAGLSCLSNLCVMAPKSGGGCGCAFGGPREGS
ncbi:MAG TPA: hypothetical protein VKQ32_08320, partial [Polyangia bacterium]|nr:hypothetical protein [Polyangia bacterium]